MPERNINSKIRANSRFYESEIWTAGEDNLETYYVYGLLAAKEAIYAFAEGRIKRRDKDPHHIVLKKSADSGRSWSKNQYVVISNNDECFCNPTPIFERKNGKIFLFYARNYDNLRSELFLISSADSGENWSAPQNLTKLFDKSPCDWTFHLPGPGHGIQTKTGRLILQVWHRRPITSPANERNYGVSVIYSDDKGETWTTGGTVPLNWAQLNESRIAELKNDKLLLNARSGAFVSSLRYMSHSSDGGLSWSEPRAVTSLSEAFATDSGFVNVALNGKNLLLLSCPKEKDSRKNLMLYFSENDGKDWKKLAAIYRGVTGYSDCATLPDKSLGIIYGRDFLDEAADVEGNIRSTSFLRFSLI